MTGPTDEALYVALLAGDVPAFDELYRRYERPLFGFIVKQLGDRDEAEDVFHEAFMATLKQRKQERELTSFRAWIFQVARNLCLNRIRSRKRAAHALDVEARSAEPTPHPELLLSASEAPAALARAAGELPEPLARVYELRIAGLSYDEIAGVLEVPLGTVKSRMHELVARLRKEIRTWTAR
jgi:RNA polymerase sigma-70 factor (ECF subfamily)